MRKTKVACWGKIYGGNFLKAGKDSLFQKICLFEKIWRCLIYGLREDEDGLFEKYLWIESKSRWLIWEWWTVGGASGVWNCQDAISPEIILKYFSSGQYWTPLQNSMQLNIDAQKFHKYGHIDAYASSKSLIFNLIWKEWLHIIHITKFKSNKMIF